MRPEHFQALQPHCPRCLDAGRNAPLRIGRIAEREGDLIIQAVLHCPQGNCQQEYPVLDGVPIIVPAVAAYLQHAMTPAMYRRDLQPDLSTLVGDAAGAGSELDVQRQQLSIYCREHYGRHDPEDQEWPRPGAMEDGLRRCFRGSAPGAPALDMGCAVGGGTLALAELCGGLALGVDLNFAMLRSAQGVLRSGRLSYERREVGLVYTSRAFPIPAASTASVDYWACDLLSLPFPGQQFASVAAMNVLDCVSHPHRLVQSLASALAADGTAVLTTPFDWSHTSGPAAYWLGGHSQRSPAGGSSESALLDVLTGHGTNQETGAFTVEEEIGELPWVLRLHRRAAMEYRGYGLRLRRTGSPPPERGKAA